MAGWAVVPRNGVLIADPALARELVKALSLLEADRHRDGFTGSSELTQLSMALAALAGGLSLSSVSQRLSSGFGERPSGRRTVTVAQASELLGKSTVWVRTLCRDEQLRAWCEGGRWLIDEEDLMDRVERAA